MTLILFSPLIQKLHHCAQMLKVNRRTEEIDEKSFFYHAFLSTPFFSGHNFLPSFVENKKIMEQKKSSEGEECVTPADAELRFLL